MSSESKNINLVDIYGDIETNLPDKIPVLRRQKGLIRRSPLTSAELGYDSPLFKGNSLLQSECCKLAKLPTKALINLSLQYGLLSNYNSSPYNIKDNYQKAINSGISDNDYELPIDVRDQLCFDLANKFYDDYQNQCKILKTLSKEEISQLTLAYNINDNENLDNLCHTISSKMILCNPELNIPDIPSSYISTYSKFILYDPVIMSDGYKINSDEFQILIEHHDLIKSLSFNDNDESKIISPYTKTDILPYAFRDFQLRDEIKEWIRNHKYPLLPQYKQLMEMVDPIVGSSKIIYEVSINNELIGNPNIKKENDHLYHHAHSKVSLKSGHKIGNLKIFKIDRKKATEILETQNENCFILRDPTLNALEHDITVICSITIKKNKDIDNMTISELDGIYTIIAFTVNIKNPEYPYASEFPLVTVLDHFDSLDAIVDKLIKMGCKYINDNFGDFYHNIELLKQKRKEIQRQIFPMVTSERLNQIKSKITDIVLDFDETITIKHTTGIFKDEDVLNNQDNILKDVRQLNFIRYVFPLLFENGIRLSIVTFGDNRNDSLTNYVHSYPEEGSNKTVKSIAGEKLLNHYLDVIFGHSRKFLRNDNGSIYHLCTSDNAIYIDDRKTCNKENTIRIGAGDFVAWYPKNDGLPNNKNKHLELLKRFDDTIEYDSTDVINKLNNIHQSMILIDDSPHNVLEAKKLGYRTINTNEGFSTLIFNML
jgi:hypothetical protein